jgi:hypothetical protein
MVPGGLGYLHVAGNRPECNSKNIGLYSAPYAYPAGIPIDYRNVFFVMAYYAARKSTYSNWLNCKDEYEVPKKEKDIERYIQFENDCFIFSIFNSSCQFASRRNVKYKGKTWNIDNQFFFYTKKEFKSLLSSQHEILLEDLEYSKQDPAFSLFLKEDIVILSDLGQQVLNRARDLIAESVFFRKDDGIHLCWNAGWNQIKPLLHDQFSSLYSEFVTNYRILCDRLRKDIAYFEFLPSL